MHEMRFGARELLYVCIALVFCSIIVVSVCAEMEIRSSIAWILSSAAAIGCIAMAALAVDMARKHVDDAAMPAEKK